MFIRSRCFICLLIIFRIKRYRRPSNRCYANGLIVTEQHRDTKFICLLFLTTWKRNLIQPLAMRRHCELQKFQDWKKWEKFLRKINKICKGTSGSVAHSHAIQIKTKSVLIGLLCFWFCECFLSRKFDGMHPTSTLFLHFLYSILHNKIFCPEAYFSVLLNDRSSYTANLVVVIKYFLFFIFASGEEEI